MHPNVTRVAAALRAAGEPDQIRELPDPAPTASAAATQLGCEVGAIANSLVFAATGNDDATRNGDTTGRADGRADDEAVLILTSGAHRVDTALAARVLGVQALRRADAELVRSATGFPIGGVPPLAHQRPLRTLVDVDLREHDVVWAAAGHPHTVFATTFDGLIRMTGGTPAKVGD